MIYLNNKDLEERARQDAYIIGRLYREAGLAVDSVYDLVNTTDSYPEAIPVLEDLLLDPNVNEPVMKEGVVRALIVKEASDGTIRRLIDLYRQIPFDAPEGWNNTKWTIAYALSYLVRDRRWYDEIAELLRDRRHGDTRDPFPIAVRKTKDPRAIDLLIELTGDPDIAVRYRAILNLGWLKAEKARPLLERLLKTGSKEDREGATKALKMLDRAREKREAQKKK